MEHNTNELHITAAHKKAEDSAEIEGKLSIFG